MDSESNIKIEKAVIKHHTDVQVDEIINMDCFMTIDKNKQITFTFPFLDNLQLSVENLDKEVFHKLFPKIANRRKG